MPQKPYLRLLIQKTYAHVLCILVFWTIEAWAGWNNYQGATEKLPQVKAIMSPLQLDAYFKDLAISNMAHPHALSNAVRVRWDSDSRPCHKALQNIQALCQGPAPITTTKLLRCCSPNNSSFETRLLTEGVCTMYIYIYVYIFIWLWIKTRVVAGPPLCYKPLPRALCYKPLSRTSV